MRRHAGNLSLQLGNGRKGEGEHKKGMEKGLGPRGRQREPWIKALHIHTVERKCTPKIHSLSQNTHVRSQATVRMPFMTAHLLIISQQAGSSASFPARASLSQRLNGVRLPSQCTLNQFYDFIFMATSPCLEKEHLLTRDSVIFKVIYFMRALK